MKTETGTKIEGHKRPTEIKTPKFPKYNEVKQWVFKIGRNCWTVSQYRDMREIFWINEVWDKTFEELGDSGEDRFHDLDKLRRYEVGNNTTKVFGS